MSDLILRPDDAAMTAYLTFRVGNQWYAVDVLRVYEVYNLVAISPVPDMPASILGVVNIRGAVVPVIDLRIRFNMADQALDLDNPIVFLHNDYDNIFGIVVDDVDDVINLSQGMISKSALNQRARHIIGLTDYRDRLIMLLDTIELLRSSLDDNSIDDFFQQVDKQEP